MPKKIDWEPIKRAYLASGESYATIASRFEVSERAVEKRASEEGWARSREEIHAEIKPKPVNKPRPTVKRSDAIDEIEVLENAIADLSADLADSPIKSKESAATALVRLLEYRQKIQPTTAADLAGRAIELGISPDQFLEELRQAWAAQS